MRINLKGAGAVLILWTLLSLLITRVLPPPWVVAARIGELRLPLLLHTAASLARSLAAMTVAAAAALPLGVLSARSARARRWLDSGVYILYPVPKIALLPVLLLLFGLGNVSKIAVVVLVLFFQIFIAVRDSVAAIGESCFEVLAGFGGGRRHSLRYIIVPAVLPALFTSLRISFATSLSVLFFAETFFTRYGLGHFIMDSWMRIDYPGMFAGIVVLSALGLAFFALFDYLEGRICRWKQDLTAP
jgi:NitT/TauT family transport system permease protein